MFIQVRGNIYVLLGVIAEVFPEYMMPYSERLVSVYLGTLKTEVPYTPDLTPHPPPLINAPTVRPPIFFQAEIDKIIWKVLP